MTPLRVANSILMLLFLFLFVSLHILDRETFYQLFGYPKVWSVQERQDKFLNLSPLSVSRVDTMTVVLFTEYTMNS